MDGAVRHGVLLMAAVVAATYALFALAGLLR
jgi:hypothetical protein